MLQEIETMRSGLRRIEHHKREIETFVALKSAINALEIARLEYVYKAGFRADQSRIPAGSHGGGQWTREGGGSFVENKPESGGVIEENPFPKPRRKTPPIDPPNNDNTLLSLLASLLGGKLPNKPVLSLNDNGQSVYTGEPDGPIESVYPIEYLLSGLLGGRLLGSLFSGIGSIFGGGVTEGDITLGDDPSSLGHIFRNEEGHIIDTSANRKILLDVANDTSTTMGSDMYGNIWSARTMPDGKQVWTQVRNGQIVNGGINSTPRIYNSQTGLSLPTKPNWKGWHIW